MTAATQATVSAFGSSPRICKIIAKTAKSTAQPVIGMVMYSIRKRPGFREPSVRRCV